MGDGPPLELRGVCKAYGPVRALDQVSFSLRSGEAVGYLGPNGAGKTTTLKLIAGLSRPGEGEVRVAGQDPSRDRRSALAHAGILIESPGVLPYMTGDDLLEYSARVKRVPLREIGVQQARVARELGVEGVLSRPLGGLSTGNLRRMLIASALMGDPELLVLDEPTLGLDPAARTELRALLRGKLREGRTLLMSTHLLEDVEAVCSRVLFLRNGKLLGDQSLPSGEGADGKGSGRAHLRLLRPVPEGQLQALVRDLGSLKEQAPRHLLVLYEGGEEKLAQIIAVLVQNGISLVQVGPGGSGLEERYLATVGREEDP